MDQHNNETGKTRASVAEMPLKDYCDAFLEACERGTLSQVSFLASLGRLEGKPNMFLWNNGLLIAAARGYLPVVRLLVEEALILMGATEELDLHLATSEALKNSQAEVVEYLTNYVPRLLSKLGTSIEN